MTTATLQCDFCKKTEFDTEVIKSWHMSLRHARVITHQFGWRVVDNKDICPKCIFLQFGRNDRSLERCDLYIIDHPNTVKYDNRGNELRRET